MSRLCRWEVVSAAACCLTFGLTIGLVFNGEAVHAEQVIAVEVPKRNWGPEQAAGEPDTTEAGDLVTAWASASADGQKEWLLCKYQPAVLPAQIVVHETYNPGAVYKITIVDADGEETTAWEGEDPTPRDQPRGISVFPVRLDAPVQRVKIYIDSPAVPGWNEIDAVGLRDADGQTRWAAEVDCSTTYAAPTPMPDPVPVTPVSPVSAEQFQKLQEDIADLKEQVEELKQLRDEIRELKELLQKPKNQKPSDTKPKDQR